MKAIRHIVSPCLIVYFEDLVVFAGLEVVVLGFKESNSFFNLGGGLLVL